MALAFFLGLGFTARAEAPEGYLEISPYTEDFEKASGSLSSYSSNISTYPEGWNRYKKSGSISYGIASSAGRSGKGLGVLSSAGATTYDFVVTTPVKGTVSFWFKKYLDSSYYTPVIQVYKILKEGDTFSCDTDAEPFYEVSSDDWKSISTEWKQATLPELDEYTYLGIKMGYAYLDDFTADSAIIPIKKELTFGTVKFEDNKTTFSCNEDGTVTLNAEVIITNTGNVKLSKETVDNYTISIARYIKQENQKNVYDTPFATVEIPELEPGSSATINIGGDYLIPDDLEINSSGQYRFPVYVIENAFSNFKQISYIDINPYKAIMNIRYTQNTSTTNTQENNVDDKVVYLGIARDKVSRKFNIKNSGPAEMIVTGFDAPDFVSVNIDGSQVNSFTVEPNGTKEVEIIISGDPGYKAGNIKFLFDGVALRDNINVAGEIVADNAFFADFEDYESGMGQWYAPSGSVAWSVGQYTSSPDERLRPQAATANGDNIYWPEYHLNEGRLSNGKNNTPGDDLISPLMSFKEGDNVSLYAAKKTNYGNDVKLIVSYSPDRNNWTTLETITPTVTGTEANAFPGVGQYSGASGQNMLKRFEFDMPEGDYYIRLTAGYVLVDNFVGGELVDVPYDIVSEGIEIGKTRIVNYPVTVSAKFKNINLKDVEPNNQIVTLYADGKPVATAEAQTIKSGENAVYLFAYTPHTEGEIAFNVELQLGDYKVSSPIESIAIDKERAENVLQIGEIMTSTSYYPLNIGYKNSKSETIYTPEDLSELKGNVISKISYRYYKANSNTVDNVKIWMTNSDNASLPTNYSTFTDVSGMELVYESQNHVFENGGGQNASDYDNMREMVFVLDTPFTYEEGKNLRVVVESRADNYSSTSFAMDNSIQKSFGYYNDNPGNYETGKGTVPSYNQKGFPVTFIYTEKEVPTVNGTVKNTAGAPVAGATIKVQSGDVIYETTTDDQGNWEMTIFQPDLIYNVYVYVNGEEVYSGSLNMEADNDIVVEGAASSDVPEGYIKVQNYLEKFSSNSVSSSRFNGPVDPLGWDKLIGDIDTSKISYTANSSGKDGYCLGQTGAWEIGPYGSKKEAFDYVITPLVKGDIKFWLKRYSTYDSGIKLYRMHKAEDGTFSCDPEVDFITDYQPDLATELPNSSTWVEQTLNIGDDFQYIGIRMQYLYLDEFSADEAIIPIKKELTLGNVTYMEGYTYKINATEDGKWKVGVQVPVTNASNIDLFADKEGEDYTISLVRVISTSNPYTYEVLQTVSLPDLAIGATETIQIEGEYDIPEDTWNDNWSCYRFRLDFVENFTEKKASKSISSWPEINPYESILELRYDKKSTSNGSITDTQVDANTPINFGSFVGERTIDFRIRNRGAAPLVVETIDKPEWVTVDEVPESIEPEGVATIKVTISGEPGLKTGNVVFNSTGKYTSNTLNLMGEVIGEDEFFADFEGEGALDVWYTPDASSNWKIGEYTTTERNYSENFYAIEYGYNNKRLQNDRQTPVNYIYSPKLAFNEDEEFSFYAAKMTNSGSDVKLIVNYSPDRVNWEELGTITVTNDNPDLQFSSGTSTSTTSSGQNIMKRFAFAMPEGEYYISLGAGYVLVDNFHGGKLVDVDYDIVAESIKGGDTRMVNLPLDVTATFKNINSQDVSAEDMKLTLYADDVPVAYAEGADIAAGESRSFELSYTPHATGDVQLYVELSIGDYKVNSAYLDVVVAEESADVQTNIGNGAASIGSVPFMFNWTHSGYETVYKAEQIEGKGLEGMNIVRIAFPYTKKDAHGASEVKIWIENTDDDAVGTAFYDGWTDDNLYYSNPEYVVPAMADGYGELTFVLDKPFVYEAGKNIRIRTNLVCQTDGRNGNTASATFKTNNEISGLKSLNWYEDTYTGTFAAKNNQYQPQLVVYTEKDVPVVTGTVTNSAGQPVEGASIKAQAKDAEVYYETVADAQGEWSMTIFQPQYEYTLTVVAEGYDVYEGELSLDAPNNVVLGGNVVVLPGDANSNGQVTVADAVTISNYIIGQLLDDDSFIHADFSVANADVNNDGIINTSDVNGTINIILYDDPFGPNAVRRHSDESVTNDRLVIEDFTVATVQPFAIPVQLMNSYEYSSISANVTIPDGMTVKDVTLGERAANHKIVFGKKDNKVAVVIFSNTNEPFADSEGSLFNLVVEADNECGNILITDIHASDARTNGYDLNFEGGKNVTDTTGIDGIGADENGVRYFTIDGIEVFNPEAGQILIRVEGNKAVKVLIK